MPQFFAVATGHSHLVNFQGFWRAVYFTAGFLLALLYAAGILTALGFAAAGNRCSNQIWFVALCVSLLIGATLLVSLRKPLFVDRYLSECQPFIVTLAAAGIVLAGETFLRRALLAMVGAILMIGLLEDGLYYGSPGHEDWRGMVSYMASQEQPGDAIICRGVDRTAIVYYRDRLKVPGKFPAIIYPEVPYPNHDTQNTHGRRRERPGALFD